MRKLQVIAFVGGILAFLASAGFVGRPMGDTLWRVGVAFMIGDLVWIQLWPAPRQS